MTPTKAIRARKPLWTRREALGTLGATAVLVPLAASAAADERTLARIMRTKLMHVGMALDPPMVQQHTDGAWYSFNPDLVRLLGKSWDVRVDFVGATWQTIVSGLLAEKYDFIGASISATPLRKKVINFTAPYIVAGQMYVVDKDKHPELDSLAALNNQNVTIAFVANTIEGEITRKLLPKARERGLLNSSIGTLVGEVVSGRSDAFCVTTHLYQPILDKFPWARIIPSNPEGVNPTPVAWGVRKDDTELLAALNKWILNEKKDGTLAALLKKDITPASFGLG